MTALDVETNIDIAVLVGEMPAVGCESVWHGNGGNGFDVGTMMHADGGECYVLIHRNCGCPPHIPGVTVRCGRWLRWVHSSQFWKCGTCGMVQTPDEWVTIIGPVEQ